MALLEYWPSLEAIRDCIKPEAESAEETLLLAVHQPMPLYRNTFRGASEEKVSEEDLLNALMIEDLPTGINLIPLAGPSGVGKTHLVRWVDARLRRHPHSDRLHIIRIPKSASLRMVVDLLLESLPKDQYPQIHRAFKDAVPTFTPHEAAVQFRAALQNVLHREHNKLRQEAMNLPLAERQVLTPRLKHLAKLPLLLNDPALEAHFLGNAASKAAPLVRLVTRAVEGRKVEGDADIQPQFELADLQIDMTTIANASKPVEFYYVFELRKELEAGNLTALDVLNEAIEGAMAECFRLSGQAGGLTLQDVIIEIRKLLLKEDKELVILVEDFAALTGLQNTLLDAVIRHGVEQGKQVLCNIRTMIAVTDKYVWGFDTVMTRAGFIWWLKQHLANDDDVLRHITEMVGAYLNAARYGLSRLHAFFTDRDWSPDIPLIPFHAPVDDAILKAFGQTSAGYSLFPFNTNALAMLARHYLINNGRIEFNPRAVIQFILIKILREQHASFEQGTFPAQMKMVTPEAEIARFLGQKVLSPIQKNQYEYLLVLWGGNPNTEKDLHSVQEGIFHAFGLEPLKELVDDGHRQPVNAALRQQESASTQVAPAEDPYIDACRKHLQEWVDNLGLPQKLASDMRAALANLINNTASWGEVNLGDVKVIADNIHIPGSRHNRDKGLVISLPEVNGDKDGFLRRSLLALMRLEHNDWQMDYPGVDDDFVLVLELGERLANQAVKAHREKADKEIKTLVPVLGIGGSMLGLAVGRSHMENALKAVFDTCKKPPAEALGNDWAGLRFKAYELRPRLQQKLLDRIACYQGKGDTAYAIDSVRFHALAKLGFFDRPLDSTLGETPDMQMHIKHCQILVVPKSKEFYTKAKIWADEICGWLGDSFDKNQVYEYLRDFRRLAMASSTDEGIWPDGSSPEQVKIDLKAFFDMNLMHVIGQVGKAANEADPVARLCYLGDIEPDEMETMRQVIHRLETFLDNLEQRVNEAVSALGGLDPAVPAKQLMTDLADADQVLDVLAGGVNV